MKYQQPSHYVKAVFLVEKSVHLWPELFYATNSQIEKALFYPIICVSAAIILYRPFRALFVLCFLTTKGYTLGLKYSAPLGLLSSISKSSVD